MGEFLLDIVKKALQITGNQTSYFLFLTPAYSFQKIFFLDLHTAETPQYHAIFLHMVIFLQIKAYFLGDAEPCSTSEF